MTACTSSWSCQFSSKCGLTELAEYELYGLTSVVWTDALMRLSMGMYCVGIYDAVMGDHTSVFMENSYVRHCPFVTYACTEEGCGLLADGQT